MGEEKVQTTNRKSSENYSGRHNSLIAGSNPAGGTNFRISAARPSAELVYSGLSPLFNAALECLIGAQVSLNSW